MIESADTSVQRLSLVPGAEKRTTIVGAVEPPVRPSSAQIVPCMDVDLATDQDPYMNTLDVTSEQASPCAISCSKWCRGIVIQTMGNTLQNSIFTQPSMQAALQRLTGMLDDLERIPIPMGCSTHCTCKPAKDFGYMLFRTCKWIVYQFEAFCEVVKKLEPDSPQMGKYWRDDEYTLATVEERVQLLCLRLCLQMVRLYRILTYLFELFRCHLVPYQTWWQEKRADILCMARRTEQLSGRPLYV